MRLLSARGRRGLSSRLRTADDGKLCLVRVLAVDWSGKAKGADRSIWLAESRNGGLVALECGRTREQLVQRVVQIAREHRRTVVGFDFAFSFPRWWCDVRGWTQVRDVWSAMAREGEELLFACEPPLWGRPGKSRPSHDGQRKTELDGPGSPKSVFQIGGAGAVGTGSIRGMPALLALNEAGFSIWPFDPAGWPRVVEIYPRELTGPVVKNSQSARLAYLEQKFPSLDSGAIATAAASEDAFDAAVSAIVMERHAGELAALEQATDPFCEIEGAIWRPAELRLVQTPVHVNPRPRLTWPDTRPAARELGKPLCSITVTGRPATFATAHEVRWKEAVRAAVKDTGVSPRPDACFSVRIEFRTPAPANVNERWDLDNLVKPTLDAMEGVFGLRAWKGVPQPNDDKVVHLDARKRTVLPGEQAGATIDVWLV